MPDPDVVAEISKRLDAIIQGLGELRADLRDLRQETQAGDAALRREIQAADAALRQEMHTFRQEMHTLRQETQAGDAALRREIQAADAALRQEIAAVRQEITAVRREMQSYFRWTITTMVALFAVAVPIWIAVIAYVLQRLLG